MESEIITGPWRATRLWNDVIRTFHQGMPLKRHRRNLRTFDHCFTGLEAVDWLHKHLKKNPNFGPDVSKDQATQLLQKLLRAQMIEDIEGKGGSEMFSLTELYRLKDNAIENLRTPGKKSPVSRLNGHNGENRRAFASLLNTPTKFSSARSDESKNWETKSELSGLRRQSSGRKKSSLAEGHGRYSMRVKEEMNRSYFQSLPPNSLIVLDNDNTWESCFVSQLKAHLGEVHLRNLRVDVDHIIFNMTKVSSKGIVQLSSECDGPDLPHWVLSAMKCLANWPRPMRMISGEESTMPNYPSFIVDVFNVVRDYFMGLTSPLIPYGLFDIFISAHIKAEAVSASSRSKYFPKPSLDARRTVSGNLFQTSTPTLTSAGNYAPYSRPAQRYYDIKTNDGVWHERIAAIRHTYEVLPPATATKLASPPQLSQTSSSFDNSTSISSVGFTEEHYNGSSAAILRSCLPPNSCFETAFVNDLPVTRIVPQKESETLHLQRRTRHRSLSRTSCYTPIPSDLDTRSIATQTSQEAENTNNASAACRRLPRWKRSSRQRKSIAVMEFPTSQEGSSRENMRVRDSLAVDGNISKGYSSLDNLLDEENSFLKRYHKISATNDLTRLAEDNVIFSKTVRKEKKKQERIKKERAASMDRLSIGRSSQVNHNRNNYYYTSSYNNLTVKTPIPDPFYLPRDMQCVRAEPYRDESSLSSEGIASAVNSFKLLSLLLPPSNRRKLQLLLKFMKRVSANNQLKLQRDGQRSNFSVVLDSFTSAILKPQGLSSYDEELCCKIVRLFIYNYDAIWMPPTSLRREVEEKVSHQN